MPEMTSDMDTIRVVSRLLTPRAWQISRPGVTMGTRMASKCCRAATKATGAAGRSSGP